MLLFVLAYLGGVLTIVSPCILPVLHFLFARAGQPFLRSTLPMLFGMAATFAAVATLAAVGGGWAVQANEYGRYIAIALLAVFGVILLFPALSDYLIRSRSISSIPACRLLPSPSAEPVLDASRRGAARGETGCEQIAARRRFPIQHLAGCKDTGKMFQHVALVDLAPGDAAGG